MQYDPDRQDHGPDPDDDNPLKSNDFRAAEPRLALELADIENGFRDFAESIGATCFYHRIVAPPTEEDGPEAIEEDARRWVRPADHLMIEVDELRWRLLRLQSEVQDRPNVGFSLCTDPSQVIYAGLWLMSDASGRFHIPAKTMMVEEEESQPISSLIKIPPTQAYDHAVGLITKRDFRESWSRDTYLIIPPEVLQQMIDRARQAESAIRELRKELPFIHDVPPSPLIYLSLHLAARTAAAKGRVVLGFRDFSLGESVRPRVAMSVVAADAKLLSAPPEKNASSFTLNGPLVEQQHCFRLSYDTSGVTELTPTDYAEKPYELN